MTKLRRVDDGLYVHFITFSCYHRRRLQDHDQPKRILLGILTDELLKFDARCIGFVIMPDHVHALIWFPKTGQLSRFMHQWKGRSSKAIKEFLFCSMPEYVSKFPKTDPIWQVRFYSFEIYTTAKIEEKLNYMHLNPVRAGLVETPTQWRWGSARWYLEGQQWEFRSSGWTDAMWPVRTSCSYVTQTLKAASGPPRHTRTAKESRPKWLGE